MMLKRKLPCAAAISGLLLLITSLSGCQTFRQIANLRLVDFAIDHITDLRLAGVPLQRAQSYEDLRATDLARIGVALSQNRLPMEFELHLAADNPEENSVEARLLEMDWTLFLEDRETISGVFAQELILPPGVTTDIPIFIKLDLLEFFGENLQDLVELALAVSGQGGAPKDIRLEAIPTIRTPLGPIRYPQPITILARDVG